MATTATHPLTTADLLAMPDDGRRRWLIRGELREQEVTIRNRFHSIAMARLTGELYVWRSAQPAPRGEIICGEAGVRLPGEPETTVVVDQPYNETQAPTVRKQLLKAGVRLAGLLTRALGD